MKFNQHMEMYLPVKISKKWLSLLAHGILLSLLFSTTSYAQRRLGYEELAHRSNAQNIFFDFFTLPGSQDSTVDFVTSFRVNHNFLPFKKLTTTHGDDQFYSTLALSIEVFKGNEKDFKKYSNLSDEMPSRRNMRNRRSRREDNSVSVKGMQSVTRSFWKDTAYAETYEQTQSDKAFITGHVQVELKQGYYNYLLQLTRGDDVNEQNSRLQAVKIDPYENQHRGNVLLVEDLDNEQTPSTLRLMNFGNNVYYGKDFYAFVHIPHYDPEVHYSLRINKIEATERDTTNKKQVFEQALQNDQIHQHIKPALEAKNKQLILSINEVEKGYAYALVKIPNSTFPNSVYQLEVNKEEEKRPVARSIFRSLWIEMPTSLLNLDIATEMLKYIVDKETLKKIQNGSREEREQKFREFWKAKDPTPDTEYNELMAEYYRRIDYAYDHFTTVNTIGYESDQGQIYIKLGPPENIDRKFPVNQPTTEIWTYDSKQFVFEATTGFGDFKLVNK